MLRSADMLHSGGRHPPAAGAELKILIFGAGGSSIRPLGTITCTCRRTWRPRLDPGLADLTSELECFDGGYGYCTL